MKCLDCKFISDPGYFGDYPFPQVRCTRGLWDKDNPASAEQWYAYGSLVRNRDPIKKHGESCTQGEPQNEE